MIACLYIVRALKRETWSNSFEKVNLRPTKRKPFEEWCLMVQDTLVSGSDFEIETYKVDPYKALPSWWRGMKKENKQEAYNIVSNNDGVFSAKCIREVKNKTCIPFSDMQTFRVCIELAQENAEQLGWEETILPPESVCTDASATNNLRNFFISGLQISNWYCQR